MSSNQPDSLKQFSTFQTKSTHSTHSTHSSSRYSATSVNKTKIFHNALADDLTLSTARQMLSSSFDSSKINLVHLTDVEYRNSQKMTRQKYEKFLNIDNPDRYYVGDNNSSSMSLKCIDEETHLYNYNFGIEGNETDITFMQRKSSRSLITRNSDIFDGVSC